MAGADRESEYKRSARNAKKADIIIGIDREISAKVDQLSNDLKNCNAKIDSAVAKLNQSRDGAASDSKVTELYDLLHKEYTEIKRELNFLAAQNENIFAELSRVIRESVAKNPSREAKPEYAAAPVQAEIDYDKLAQKVIELMPAQEYVSADYIACKVAEQIVIPESSTVISPAPVYDASAYRTETPVDIRIDEDELADKIALKIGALKAEDFDIIVDDDGCDSISKDIVEKLNYEVISSAVAEKLRPALAGVADNTDYEEMATRISEKINISGINEDAIADKAAAALSNYLPEIDADEIADKVAGQVLSGMPAVEVDSEKICKNITDRIIETQENHDYDIIIDEDGIEKITGYVSEEVTKSTDARFNEIRESTAQRFNEISESTDARFDEIQNSADKRLNEVLASTDNRFKEVQSSTNERFDEVLTSTDERLNEIQNKTDERFDEVNRKIDEIKALLAGGVLIAGAAGPHREKYSELSADESLVTVSDLVYEQGDTSVEQLTIDQVSDGGIQVAEPVEEKGISDDEMMEELVSDLDEIPSEGEITSEDLEGMGGVDFEHMMKYNRSFIARIIQSTDEQKEYYGQVKTALLSYAKVNSNVAWGSERFNKGRETIARFKIRGKTLCLYLALDPHAYKTSVYHQIDVSDNKSVSGTPMMVKIKSPLGARKAIRLVDEMLDQLGGVKRNKVIERDYAAMYPYETIEELIEDGLIKDVSKNK